jgi:hypothetical protein
VWKPVAPALEEAEITAETLQKISFEPIAKSVEFGKRAKRRVWTGNKYLGTTEIAVIEGRTD